MGPSVTSAFESVLKDARYSKPVGRRPVWVQTDRGKEFLNRLFQEMLKREGLRFPVCLNPDLNCAVVDRAHRTLRDKLYIYLRYKNTRRFVDVLQLFVGVYNDTVPTALGMFPAVVTDKHVLEIGTRMNRKRSRFSRVAKLGFAVGQHVSFSREKMRFAKGSEVTYTDEIYRIR